MGDSISNEIHLVGELFRELLDKFNKAESKKHIYKSIDELTLIEINTVIVIGCKDKVSMSHIANKLGVSFGTPTVTIDRLITKGYVERLRDDEDRRQVFVSLTKKGRDVHNTIVQIKSKVTEKIFGILEPQERQVFISILSKLNSRFEELFF